ncbi:MAG: hypothetical protein U0939_10240 [Pirellulales bacterium]
MYEQVLENLKKATQQSVEMQQEMMRKWAAMLPPMPSMPGMAGMAGAPTSGSATSSSATSAAAAGAAAGAAATEAWEGLRRMQQRWEESVTEVFKRQREMVDAHYAAGLKSLEELFRLSDAKSPQEYQEKVLELYRHSFESFRTLSEAQLKEFKAIADQVLALAAKKV